MLRIGIIGAGGIARHRTIPAILTSGCAAVAALCDSNEETLRVVSAESGVTRCHTDIREFLQEEGMDAVYIATPVFLHEEQARLALEAGCHVLCEKPAARSLEEYGRMEQASRRANRLLVTGYVMRHHPLHQAAGRLLREGALGDVLSCRLRFCCDYPEQPGDWRQRPELSGGGSLMDMGIHAIDLAGFLLRESPQDVFCWPRNVRYRYEVEDAGDLLWRTSGGALVHVAAHFCSPSDVAESRVELLGTRGSLELCGTLSQQGGGRGSLLLAGQPPQELPHSPCDIYREQVRAFASRVAEGTAGEGDAFAQRMLSLGYESARQGRWLAF